MAFLCLLEIANFIVLYPPMADVTDSPHRQPVSAFSNDGTTILHKALCDSYDTPGTKPRNPLPGILWRSHI
jgi:hypothetical protein